MYAFREHVVHMMYDSINAGAIDTIFYLSLSNDVDAFGLGNGDTLGLCPLGDLRGEFGNGNNSPSSTSMGNDDGFGGGGDNR
jgi:hypothetical protein